MSSNPEHYVQRMGKKFPKVWKLVDEYRANREGFVKTWPDWCFLPITGSIEILFNEVEGDYLKCMSMDHTLIASAAELSALSAWRITQRVYKFDKDLEKGLINSTITGNMPVSDFDCLPEWCVYIEMHEFFIEKIKIDGIFVHLEHDDNTSDKELRILLDISGVLMPIVLCIGPWSVEEAIEKVRAAFMRNSHEVSREVLNFTNRFIDAKNIKSLLSLILYLCINHESSGQRPYKSRPAEKRTKKGLRFFPPDKPKVVELGRYMTNKISSKKEEPKNYAGYGSTKKAHIRSGHWHKYWYGERGGDGNYRYKWLPMMGINFDIRDEMGGA